MTAETFKQPKKISKWNKKEQERSLYLKIVICDTIGGSSIEIRNVLYTEAWKTFWKCYSFAVSLISENVNENTWN